MRAMLNSSTRSARGERDRRMSSRLHVDLTSASEKRDLASEVEELQRLVNDLSERTRSQEALPESLQECHTIDTIPHHELTNMGNSSRGMGNISRRSMLMPKPGHDSTHLSEDTFAFLIAARPGSFPFFSAVVVVVIKATMYSLIFADMLQNGSPGNPLGIAASLEWPVAVSQFLAVASK